MDLELDFSYLSSLLGDYPDGITQAEVRSVLQNPKFRLSPIEGYPIQDFYSIACGYSLKQRILLVALRIEDLRWKILQVKVADEEEIEQYYCER